MQELYILIIKYSEKETKLEVIQQNLVVHWNEFNRNRSRSLRTDGQMDVIKSAWTSWPF